ncbi:MAG: hypothetical protein SFZ24_11675 [Planctomycetota bacterium]|nr:hypothetical protein [Planctomycetota bacterium]
MIRGVVIGGCLAIAITLGTARSVHAQSIGTAITYQGHVDESGALVNGTADFQVTLWTAAVAGTQVGPTLSFSGVQVTDGFFSLTLDFGPTAWTGSVRWLQVASRVPAGGGAFVNLPRQQIMPVPFAVKAGSLADGNLGLGGVNNPLYPLTFSNTLGDKISLYGNASNHFGFGVQASQFQMFTDSVNADITFGYKNTQGSLVEVMRMQGDGRLGIGTTNARSKLHLLGNANVMTLEGTDHAFIEIFPDAIAGGRGGYIGFAGAASNNLVLRNERTGAHLILGTTTAGNVGIGLVDGGTPTAKLDVNGSLKATAFQLTGNGAGAGKVLGSDAAGVASWITMPGSGSQWTTAGANIHYNAGNVGIGTSSPVAKLDVQGTARVNTLEIDAGADLAENFDIASALVGEETIVAAPGMVVSIDRDEVGKLVVSSDAYDRRVAGIVSGAGGVNPGLTLSQPGTIADGEHPVASVGRVWCYADADAGGPIEAGDILTTSPTAGHAMRAGDAARAPGATIGKAMSSLEKGKGLVLVLVSLQ